ncbi:MAG: GNAT family N-acetyltransferase [Candidatus Woesearchaeota archaeon]
MDIIHDEQFHKFYAMIDNKECFVDYSIDGNTIDFFHTYVPQLLRGQGIARKLYDHIYEWLKEKDKSGQKMIIKTSCSYAKKYFEEKK